MPSCCPREPGIEDLDAGSGEIGLVARDEDQPVHERGGGDEGVAVGARVGDVELGAAPGDGYVHAEQPVAEPGENPLLQPQPEHRALGGVAALDAEDADLQLEQRDRREPEQAGRGVLRPARTVASARAPLRSSETRLVSRR